MSTLMITGIDELKDKLKAEMDALSACRDRIRELKNEIEMFEDISERAVQSLEEAADVLSEQV